VAPDRLSRAKAEIAAMAEELSGNRVGLIAFAGTAFVQCPLTTDLSALRMFLNALDPDVVPQGGTALARALAVADRLFAGSAEMAAESGRGHAQVLVLITDGEDHEGAVEEVAARLQRRSVTTFVVGVGSEAGEPIPLEGENGAIIGYLKDKRGQPVLSRLDPPTIQALATAAGGEALVGPDLAGNLTAVARAVDRLEKSEFESRLVVQYQERFQWPLAFGLGALLLALTMRLRRRAAPEAS
jgi:Ca-activated chloride channel family protein